MNLPLSKSFKLTSTVTVTVSSHHCNLCLNLLAQMRTCAITKALQKQGGIKNRALVAAIKKVILYSFPLILRNADRLSNDFHHETDRQTPI